MPIVKLNHIKLTLHELVTFGNVRPSGRFDVLDAMRWAVKMIRATDVILARLGMEPAASGTVHRRATLDLADNGVNHLM